MKFIKKMAIYREIEHSAGELFEKTLKKVQGQLAINRKDADAGLALLAKFSELENCRRVFVHKVTEFKNHSGSFIVLLVEKHLAIIEQKKHVRIEKEIEEVEPILIFNIAEDPGRAHMRKETLADKFADLFTKIDIDFAAYPSFSTNYYLVGEDPEQIKRHFPEKLKKVLNDTPDLIVELNGHYGLIRTERNLTEQNLTLLIGIGKRLIK